MFLSLDLQPLPQNPCIGHVKHLRSSAFTKTFSNLFYTELAHFLLTLANINKYDENIQKQLRKIPQQELAGRPGHSIGKLVANEINTEGLKIYQVLQNMQKSIKHWKDLDLKIDDTAIRKKLSRSYPAKAHPWMPFFHELIPKLPPKPYFDSKGNTTEVLDDNDKLLPAKLREPDRWSTIAIAVKILQGKLLRERNTKFPLRGIRKVLAKALPQVKN